MLVVDILKFILHSIPISWKKHLNCRKFVNITVLNGVGYSLVPFCINYKAREQQCQKKISQIPELDLPGIMPKFNKSRVDAQPCRKYKRFSSTLAGILLDGVNTFVNHKKHSVLQKSMKKLLAWKKVSEGKIAALWTQIVSITQTSLKEIERLQTDTIESNKSPEMLTQHIIHMKLIMDEFILKVNDNANAIKLLAFILGRISANMERNLSKYNCWQI